MKLMILIATMLFISGCGAPALQSKPEQVSTLPQGRGVIIGSIVLKTRNESAMFPIALSEQKWHIWVRPVDDSFLGKIFPPAGKSLDLNADGKEVPFVSVLPPGMFMIENLYSTSALEPPYELSLRLRFAVEENKKTYIGRLVITIPSHVNMFKTLLFGNKNVSIDIEDAQADAMALLSGEYGTNLAEGLQKGLMAVRSPNQRVQTEAP
jgi:hypothetical protein